VKSFLPSIEAVRLEVENFCGFCRRRLLITRQESVGLITIRHSNVLLNRCTTRIDKFAEAARTGERLSETDSDLRLKFARA